MKTKITFYNIFEKIIYRFGFVHFQDPKDYLTHYEKMLEFVQTPQAMPIMLEELGYRNVKCINFYDVVIDFVLLDAFDEVEKPPSSIKAILQNRWISASFRETVCLNFLISSRFLTHEI